MGKSWMETCNCILGSLGSGERNLLRKFVSEAGAGAASFCQKLASYLNKQ
jgi:hypothetical protein